MPWECQSGVCDDGLQPVAWTVELLWGTPEHVQFISKEILGGLNWIPLPQYLHYIFSGNLRKVDVRTQHRELKETPHHGRRRTRWCLPPENKPDVKPEPVCIVQSDLSKQGSGTSFTFRYQLGRNTILSPCSSQLSMASSRASTEIQEKLKSKSSSRRLFATLIPPLVSYFSTQELSFWRN